jgi:large subunit ribosomal protein L15
MKLNELTDNPGAVKSRTRVGRGIGSGKGKTGGRGVKGQKARSGVAIKAFEGGQMPLHRRLPKRGFVNIFARDLHEINLGRLQQAIDAGKVDVSKPVTMESLVDAGLFAKNKDGLKILGQGELTTKIDVQVAGASKSAAAAIEKLGGTVTILSGGKNAEAGSTDAA